MPGDRNDYMATFNEFWRELVTDDTGQLDLDKVARELADYSLLLDEVPKAYDEVTGGQLSKPNTAAHHVVAAADERAADHYARELCEVADRLDWDVNVSLALREVAEEWKPGAWQEWLDAKAQRERVREHVRDGELP